MDFHEFVPKLVHDITEQDIIMEQLILQER